MSVSTSTLFVLRGNSKTLDLTNFIVVPSYTVNDKPMYSEWTDANLRSHREIHRYKAAGSFTLLFTNVDDLTNFLDFYNNNVNDDESGGSILATLYINNTNTKRNARVFIDFDITEQIPILGTGESEGIEVTVEEL